MVRGVYSSKTLGLGEKDDIAIAKFAVDGWVRFSRHVTLVHASFWCRIFLHHACVFQHVRPLPARSCVAVLKMLSKLIRPEDLLLVALPKLVVHHEVLRTLGCSP